MVKEALDNQFHCCVCLSLHGGLLWVAVGEEQEGSKTNTTQGGFTLVNIRLELGLESE